MSSYIFTQATKCITRKQESTGIIYKGIKKLFTEISTENVGNLIITF